MKRCRVLTILTLFLWQTQAFAGSYSWGDQPPVPPPCPTDHNWLNSCNWGQAFQTLFPGSLQNVKDSATLSDTVNVFGDLNPLTSVTVDGGTLNFQTGPEFRIYSIDVLSLPNSGSVFVPNGVSVVVNQIAGNGEVKVDTPGSGGLVFTGANSSNTTATISGRGVVDYANLSNSGNIVAQGDFVLRSRDNTAPWSQGAISNSGTLYAQGSHLFLDTDVINSGGGALTADTGGELIALGSSITGGAITINAFSQLTLPMGTGGPTQPFQLSGGQITVANGGRLVNERRDTTLSSGLNNQGHVITELPGGQCCARVLTLNGAAKQNDGTIEARFGGNVQVDTTVTGNGTWWANGGYFNFTSKAVVDAGIVQVVGGTGQIDNHGIITHHFSNAGGTVIGGDLHLDSGSVLNNFGGYLLMGDVNVLPTGGVPSPVAGTFNNTGLFSKIGGTGISEVGVPFDNSTGSVEVHSGTLKFDFVPQISGSTLTGGGWSVFQNSELQLPGGPIVTNNGNVFLSGSNSIFSNIDSLTVNHGTFGIDNGRNFTTQGALTNSGGVIVGFASTLTIGGSGDYTQTAGNTLVFGALNAGAIHLTGGRLDNNGIITQYFSSSGGAIFGGDLQIDPSAVVNNFAGYLLMGDVNVLSTGGVASPFAGTFHNSGLFSKESGTGVSEVGVPFDNSTGSVEVHSGTLKFDFVPQVSGNTLTGGGWSVFQNSELQLPGGPILTNNGNVFLTGPNSIFTNIDSLADNHGVFSLDQGRNFTTKGALTNSGLVSVGIGSTLTIGGTGDYTQTAGTTIVFGTFNAGTLYLNGGLLGGGGTINGSLSVNNATIGPGNSPGYMVVTGDLTESDLTTLLMELAGTTRGVTYDALDVTGNMFLNGVLDVRLLNGFLPAPGSVFQLIHVGGSLSGTFDSILLPAFSDSRFWQLTYSSHDVFLNVGSGAVPEPSDAILGALGVAALAILRRLQSVKRRRRWQLLKHFATARHFLH